MHCRAESAWHGLDVLFGVIGRVDEQESIDGSIDAHYVYILFPYVVCEIYTDTHEIAHIRFAKNPSLRLARASTALQQAKETAPDRGS